MELDDGESHSYIQCHFRFAVLPFLKILEAEDSQTTESTERTEKEVSQNNSEKHCLNFVSGQSGGRRRNGGGD